MAYWLEALGKIDDVRDAQKKYYKYICMLSRPDFVIRMDFFEADNELFIGNSQVLSPIDFLGQLSKVSGHILRHDIRIGEVLIVLKSLKKVVN